MLIPMEVQLAATQLDATREHIVDYLSHALRRADAEGFDTAGLPMPGDWYDADTHAQVEAAREWWPREITQALSWDSAFSTALGTYAPALPTLRRGGVLEVLAEQGQRVRAALEAEGRDVVRPNEDKAERMRRLNRERVAAHRQKAREAEPEHVRILRQQVVAMRAQARSIRVQAKTATSDAYNEMMRIRREGEARVVWAQEQVEEAERLLADALSAPAPPPAPAQD